jgi:hypothetical protein
MKHSPLPWIAGQTPTEGGSGRYMAYSLVDAEGRVVADCLNSQVAMIETDFDEKDGFRHCWDEQGRADFDFMVRAINSHNELLEALDAAAAELHGFADVGCSNKAAHLYEMCREVIARAKGHTP